MEREMYKELYERWVNNPILADDEKKELLEKEVNVEIVEAHFADYYHYI